ncbi:hypothetical protein LTR84_010304 [Exophiala bonariae]|uniref:Transcription factor domain-containing protein n=1 Tax=Exophiala bonariae TaxID=1690606 RepID=A0AAV9MW50_9EURO|nr:hypothetical protein LTR84_010304 [Exophiala bonariae]
MAEWAHLIRDNPDDEGTSNVTDMNDADTNATSSDTISPQYVHQRDADSSMALWKGSPIHLLNSSVASQILNTSLGDVYNSMMSGITTRYLDYNCNLFAGPYKYTFEPEDLGQPMTPADAETQNPGTGIPVNIPNSKRNYLPPWRRSNCNYLPDTLQNRTFLPEQVDSQISRVTMIGVARFLDNFGPLYGNCVNRETRESDEKALTAVLQAFALQFAPSDSRSGPLELNFSPSQVNSRFQKPKSNNAQVYKAAWHHAYQNLLDSSDNRTFVHIYTVFLFQMTVVPSEGPAAKDVEGTPLGFLDLALLQMTELQRLVESYSKDLKFESLYRFLLDSSLAIFRWYGIVRDSIASMLSDRACFMDEPPIRIRDISQQSAVDTAEQWQQPSSFEQCVASNCQNAAGDLFHMLRQMTHLKQFIATATPEIDSAILKTRVESAIILTEGFDSTYQPWLEQCIVMFYRLSNKSKLATAFLLLFWNLGHLCLVEQIHYAAHLLGPDVGHALLCKADTLQESAVAFVLAIARRIVDVSSNGEFKLINSIQAKLQFVSHHANTALVVMALVKGIEHTIDYNLSKQPAKKQTRTGGSNPNAQPVWIPSIKPLLTCLLALESTVSGVFTARPALQKLMHEYSDVLMDCWSSEDSRESI